MHIDSKLFLKDKFALLVLLCRHIRSIVLPPKRGLALDAGDVAHRMQTRSHMTILRFAKVDIGNRVEEIRSTVLAVEGAADEILDGGEVSLAVFAAKDALTAEVLLVCHAHLDLLARA